MDYANKKLENGLEPIYDHVRRPFKRLYLNRAVTQNYLRGHKLYCWILESIKAASAQ